MELLLRNPKKTIEDHSLTIDAVLLDLLDDSVRNEGQAAEEGKEAAMATFALRHGSSAIPRILKTLTIVLSKRMTTEADQSEILQLKVLGQPAHRGKLAKTLLELLAKILGKAKPGESVPLNELIATLAQVLREKELQPLAFDIITRLSEASGAALLSLVPKIVSLLTSNLDTPSAALFACIGKYAELYGPSSGLQTRLFDIWTSMVQPLHEQEYKNEAAYAVSQIITRSGYLVKPEVLQTVARAACQWALRYPGVEAAHVIVASLLTAQNEHVPPPVHIARRLCVLCPTSAVRPRLLGLTDSLARPRLHDVASLRVRSLQPVKETLDDESQLLHIDEKARENRRLLNNTSEPIPDVDICLTEDEMEENEENPTHFRIKGPLHQDGDAQETPDLAVNLTEDELEILEDETNRANQARLAQKTKNFNSKKRKRNRTKELTFEKSDGGAPDIEVALTEDEMAENDATHIVKVPMTKRSKKLQQKRLRLAQESQRDEQPEATQATPATKSTDGIARSTFVSQLEQRLDKKERAKKKKEKQGAAPTSVAQSTPSAPEAYPQSVQDILNCFYTE
ncbi:unnamed protein product, partial [Mesorhabditis spiculigera]